MSTVAKGQGGERNSWARFDHLLASKLTERDRREVVRHLLHRGESSGAAESAAPGCSEYDEVFARAVKSMDAARRQLAEEKRQANAQWAALEGHPQARRLVMIRNDSRFQSWGLFYCLLERYREIAPSLPEEALETAEMALAVAESLDPARYGEERIADFRAQALAALGEARQQTADLDGARQALESARECLESGSGDPLEKADVESLRAKVLHHLGDDGEAERSERRARILYHRIGQSGGRDEPRQREPRRAGARRQQRQAR
jgi:hypothetical protein